MALAEVAPAACESLTEAWLRGADGVLHRAAVAAAARGRFVRLAPTVADLVTAGDADTRREIAEALGVLGDPATEPALLRLLEDASTQVQCAAARSLGSIGSVLAVEPLMPHTEGLGNAQRRQAARAAIGQIQSRLGNVEAGRVSLAEDALSGAVSLAGQGSEAAGALSLSAERHTRKP
jgi:HEAT repeat protein